MSANANKEIADRLRGRGPDQKTLDQARQAGREVSAQGDRQPGQSAVEKLSQKDRAVLEGIGARLQAASVQGEKSTSPPAKSQESDFTGTREHGKHKGNVIAPAATQVQQNPTAAQQPTAENKTLAAAQAVSKQQVLDQAKAYAGKAASQQAASSREAKAPAKGQHKEQANSARKAPAKGRGR